VYGSQKHSALCLVWNSSAGTDQYLAIPIFWTFKCPSQSQGRRLQNMPHMKKKKNCAQCSKVIHYEIRAQTIYTASKFSNNRKGIEFMTIWATLTLNALWPTNYIVFDAIVTLSSHHLRIHHSVSLLSLHVHVPIGLLLLIIRKYNNNSGNRS